MHLQLLTYLGICYAVSASSVHFRKISLWINAVATLFQFLKSIITPMKVQSKNTKNTLKFWVLHLTNFKPMYINNKTWLKEIQTEVNQKWTLSCLPYNFRNFRMVPVPSVMYFKAVHKRLRPCNLHLSDSFTYP